MRNPSSEVQPAEQRRLASARALCRSRRVAVVLYGAVALLYWASLYTYVPTLPTYAATLTPDLALIGTILSMYGLWQALDPAARRHRIRLGRLAQALYRGRPRAVGRRRAADGLRAHAPGPADRAVDHRARRRNVGAADGRLQLALSAGDRPSRRRPPSPSCPPSPGSLARPPTGPLNALGGYGLAFLVAAVLAGIAILLVLPADEPRRPAKAPTAGGIARLAGRRDVLLPAGLSARGALRADGPRVRVRRAAGEGTLGAADSIVSNLTVVHLAVFTPSVLAAAFLLRRFDKRPLLLVSFVALALGAACGALANFGGLAAGRTGAGRHRLRHLLPDPHGHEHRAGRRGRTSHSDGRPPIGLRDRACLPARGSAASSRRRSGMRPMFAVTAVATLDDRRRRHAVGDRSGTARPRGGTEMQVVFVHVHVKPEYHRAVQGADASTTRRTACRSRGSRASTSSRTSTTPTRFVLIEAYRTADAPASHKETAHYARWRDGVADMMAEPRSAVKYESVFLPD